MTSSPGDEPTTVHIATAETDRYMWQGVGATPEQATEALMTAWYAHADTVDADPDYLTRDQVHVIAAQLGQGFRDWDPFPRAFPPLP